LARRRNSNEICEIGNIKGYIDGYIKVLGNILFFKMFGEVNNKGNVLCLHGSVGSCDPYSNLATLTERGYRVVVYDQLGCSRSERPQDISLYNIEHYVEEVEGIRKALNLGKVHLYGGSWGGFLNVAYAVEYSKSLKSLIVSSGTSSDPLYRNELAKMHEAMPKKIREAIKKYEKIGDQRNPEYQNAMRVFFKKHAYRVEPWPLDLQLVDRRLLTEDRLFGRNPNAINKYLDGENGALRYWDVTDQLGNIDVPTLIVCGEYDFVSPKCSELLHERIRDSELLIFKNCGHALARQEQKKYVRVIGDFLDTVSNHEPLKRRRKLI
jgi:proline-specific peptidase